MRIAGFPEDLPPRIPPKLLSLEVLASMGDATYSEQSDPVTESSGFFSKLRHGHPMAYKLLVAGVTVAFVAAAAFGAYLLLPKVLGGEDHSKLKKEDKKTPFATVESLPIDFNIQNGDSIKLEDAVEDEQGLVLKFTHYDVVKGDKKSSVPYEARISKDSVGTYVQSEEWIKESDRNLVVFENVRFADYPGLFSKSSGNDFDTLNRIIGQLHVKDGTYIIDNVTRLALYDGRVFELADSTQDFTGVVKSVEDMPAGAKHVTIVVPNRDYKKELYFFGNRLYATADSGYETTQSLGLAPGDIIKVSTRDVNKWGDRVPQAEQIPNAHAVLSVSKVK